MDSSQAFMQVLVIFGIACIICIGIVITTGIVLLKRDKKRRENAR